MSITTRRATLHGTGISYREYRPSDGCVPIGDDDPVVLLHGIAGSSHTWDAVLRELIRRRFPRTVIAPDLLGHGDSEAPDGDYSPGALTNVVRDLLASLGHEHVTVAGHSLGGGIAMQFAYQFPQLCGRLVLVSTGGLGRDVTPLLRAAAIPGAGLVIPMLANPVTVAAASGLSRLAGRLGVGPSAEHVEFGRHFGSLADRDRRIAFLRTARGTIDLRGQRINALARLYLTESLPTMLVWGDKDAVIPVEHGRAAAAMMAGSRFEVFEGAGHFPHCAQPARFVDALVDFLDTTAPASLQTAELATRLAG
jgi:pimeloyl-ACP methyl ester carboxylesterase